MPIWTTRLILILTLLWPGLGQAIWFEASGQAAIDGNNRQLARQQATEEAIKQALLFAGASVKSVQQMADGLLQQDSFEVRAAGEVHALELIDEIYSDGYVTVSIRADIFAQETFCSAADYSKSLVTAWYPISHREQANVGNLHELGQVLPMAMRSKLATLGQHTRLQNVAKFYFSDILVSDVQQITALARKYNSQYVLTGKIDELSFQQAESTGLAFWRTNHPTRHFSITFSLFDGHTGGQLFQKRFSTQTKWEFGRFDSLDVNSQALWDSAFGQGIMALLQEAAVDIDEMLGCEPAYGRVLSVANERLTINIGSGMGVKRGDQLSLLQLNQFHDPQGQLHVSYQLHPTKVRVTQLTANSAVVESIDGSYLANIQPNDFVSRH